MKLRLSFYPLPLSPDIFLQPPTVFIAVNTTDVQGSTSPVLYALDSLLGEFTPFDGLTALTSGSGR